MKHVNPFFRLLIFLMLAWIPESNFAQCQCSVSADYTVGDGVGIPTFFSSSIPNTGASNAIIHVCGEFVLDVPGVVFDLCKFELEPNAQLTIPSGIGVQFVNQCILTNCGSSYWNGVLVESGGGLFIDDALEIQGALTGIILQSGSTAWITNSVFDGNSRHITVSGTPNLLVAGNDFFAVTQVPGLNLLPNIAIDAGYATCQIGVVGLENNFRDLQQFGIRSVGSAISLRGNDFIQDQKPSLSGSTYSCIAALSGSYLDMMDNSINLCKTGVYTSNSSANIRFNQFQDFITGLELDLYPMDNADVYRNQLSTSPSVNRSQRGVKMDNFGGKLRVFDNQMDIVEPSGGGLVGAFGVGIYGLGANADARVSQHDMSGNSGYIKVEGSSLASGVYLEFVENANIISNDIEVILTNTQSNHAGVNIQGGGSNILRDNKLSSTSTNFVHGVNTVNSPRNLYCCNEVTTVNSGFQFIGQCDDSRLTQSDILNSTNGLNILDVSLMGIQNFEGNEWGGVYSSLGAMNQNSSIPLISASEFEVNAQLAPVHPPTLFPGGGVWFDVKPGGHSPCGATSSCPTTIGNEDAISPVDDYVVENIIDTLLPAGYVWISKRNLLDKLEKTPSLVNSSVEMQNWYNSQYNSLFQQLYVLENAIKSTLLMDQSLRDSLSSYFMSIENKFIELHTFDQGLVSMPTTQWANHVDDRLDLINHIDSLKLESENFKSTIDANLIGQLDLLLYDLNVIIPSDPIDVNLKAVLSILLSELIEGRFDLDSNQKSTVEVIANSCVEISGPCVYLARNMVRKYNPLAFFDDDLLCQQSSLILGSEDPKLIDFEIYPNPTEGIIYWEGNFSGEIMICNSSGKLCKRIDASENKLDVNNLSNGVFFIQFVNSDISVIKKVIKE